MTGTILYDVNAHQATITFNRPQAMNTLNPEFVDDFLQVLQQVQADEHVRAILLCGAGKTFMAGGDISYFHANLDTLPDTVGAVMDKVNACVTLLQNLKQPILAKLHGSVAGIGISFMAACDLAIAAESTKFTLAYSNIGITPDGGAAYLLPRLIGTRRAMQLALLPEVFAAAQARDMGLINFIAPDNELDAQTQQLLDKLAAGPTQVYARSKALINKTWGRSLATHLQAEREMFVASTADEDFRRGVTAFVNKKKPVFGGK